MDVLHEDSKNQLKMEKNEIVINGVHHVLVEDGDIKIPCDHCSLLSLCALIPNDILCRRECGVTNCHFESNWVMKIPRINTDLKGLKECHGKE